MGPEGHSPAWEPSPTVAHSRVVRRPVMVKELPPGWRQVTWTVYVVEEERGPSVAEVAFPGASVCKVGGHRGGAWS